MRTLAALAALALAACSTAVLQEGGVQLSQSNLRDGDVEAALGYAESAIAYGPVDPMKQLEGYFMKAVILERLERKKEAAGLYGYIAKTMPGTELAARAAARGHDLEEACRAPNAAAR